MPEIIKKVVLLSGGIDSATCLDLALKDVNHYDQVKALSCFYGQKHDRELRAAEEICRWYAVQRYEVRLPELIFKGTQSTLVKGGPDNPETTYEEMARSSGPSPTYVPFRNGNMISAATAFCLSLGATRENPIELYYGAHAEDAANWAYPDCTPEFNGAMANAVYVGSYMAVRLITPLQWMTKDEIVRISGAPLGRTYSCYNGGDFHCGTCPTCVARAAAFVKAGRVDPTTYQVAPPLKGLV